MPANRIGSITTALFILVFFFPGSVLLWGQNHFFLKIAGSSGLDESQINCIFQDHSGFIWIGTRKGIYKYNGTTFRKLNDPDNLTAAGVSAIYEDKDFILWFGLENGNIIQYVRNSTLSRIPASFDVTCKISGITDGFNGSLWISTHGEGLLIVENDSIKKPSINQNFSDNYFYNLVKDFRNRYWIGTDNGINVITGEQNKLKVTSIGVNDGLPDLIVQCIREDRSGRLWIGMHEFGICRYDPENNEIYIPELLSDWKFGAVNDIHIQDDRIWVATEGSGIIEYIFEGNVIHQYVNGNTANLNRIRSMMKDKEGNIWLISNSEIVISYGNRLEYLQQIGDLQVVNVHSLVADHSENIWFANDQGLYRIYNHPVDQAVSYKKYPLDLDLARQKIMSLFPDKFGYIWIGTFGNGVYRLNPEDGKQIRLDEKNGLVNGNVLSIQGTESEIWFATLGGVSRLEIRESDAALVPLSTFENFGQNEGLSNHFIYHICIDYSGKAWFASDGGGVFFFEDGRFYPLQGNSEENDEIIYSIAAGHDNNLWLNVAHKGLFHFQHGQIKNHYFDPEHSSSSFSAIAVSKFGELIALHDDGFDVVEIETGHVSHFESNVGLDRINPDLNAITMDAKGNVLMGTSGGILKYNGRNRQVWDKPMTMIEEVAVFLNEIDRTGKTIFGHDQNHFTFSYAGLWFQFPKKVAYWVKLEGHDLDWIKTRDINITYSNLAPGKYTFRVRSGIYDNFDLASEDHYTFTIRKPYWQSYGFYLMILAVLATIVILLIRAREKRLREKQQALREKVIFQFENLKSQINPHFLFNSFSTLISLIETDRKAAIEYVDELSALFRNVLEYKEKDLVSLGEEFRIIHNYIRLQKKRFAENLQITIHESPEALHLLIAPLSLQLLIENALKHNIVSKERPLYIEVTPDIERGYVFVKNNLQHKQEVLTSTGIGIEHIINRYKILTDRKIVIEKTEDSFLVGIPIIEVI